MHRRNSAPGKGWVYLLGRARSGVSRHAARPRAGALPRSSQSAEATGEILQIGVEGVDIIMLVMNDQGFQHLLSSKFELSGDASAAAGPVGRHASAGTDWKMNTEVLTYSRAQGLFGRNHSEWRCGSAGRRLDTCNLRSGGFLPEHSVR